MAFCHVARRPGGVDTFNRRPAAPARGEATVKSPVRPTASRSLRLATALLLCLLGIGVVAPMPASTTDAPLDTLVSEEPAAALGHFGISRRLLPDVSATTIPRQPPPAIPPRLDDPERGWRLFLNARNVGDLATDARLDNLRLARDARPNDSRIPIWQVMQALHDRDVGAFVWHLPGAVRAGLGDPLAAPRLLVQAHQGAVLLLVLFWTALVAAGLIATWRYQAHDLTALLVSDPRHQLRLWTPWLLLVAVIMARPGWLGGLALLSIPVLMQLRGRARNLLLGTWLVALAVVFPNWPILRQAMPVLDPDSESSMLVRAVEWEASSSLIGELRERLTHSDDPERRHRLRLALAHQEARRGRYTVSNQLFDEVLAERPEDLSALVGRANNFYFLSRFDEALAGYHRARQLAPERGEIPFNQAQVYFKKLFIPEAGQALADARRLGFDPPAWSDREQQQGVFSPTAYLGLLRHDLRASARHEASLYPPLSWLSSWNYFLGAPPLPLFVLLAGLLVVALALAYWGGVKDDVRACDACGAEICRSCCTVREEGWLCRECAETAERSRSEMVLATLLKNRSRAAGLATTSRLVWQARLLPGSAFLALGEPGRAFGRLAMLALALFLITCGWAFDPASTWSSPGLVLASEAVHPLWWPLPASAWPGLMAWPVVVGWILLAAVYLGGLIDGARLRERIPERFIQVHHPASIPGPGRA